MCVNWILDGLTEQKTEIRTEKRISDKNRGDNGLGVVPKIFESWFKARLGYEKYRNLVIK